MAKFVLSTTRTMNSQKLAF